MAMSGNSSRLVELGAKVDQFQSKKPELQSEAANISRTERFRPPDLRSLADTGLSVSLVSQLILKTLSLRGDLIASDLCRAVGLRFSFIEDIVEGFKSQQIIQVKKSLGFGAISSLLALTEQGRQVAQGYLENNQYVGPAPVPITQYSAAVEAQRLPAGWLTAERLTNAYSHLVVTDEMLNQIGPAVSSGKSFLIYGKPGNGKTRLAEALSNIQGTAIYVPYALECQGNIIQLFDPVYHQPVTEEKNSENRSDDGRWARCRRPFIASGGELSLSMLDLSYNLVSKVYDAPFHLKANNGIYLVDDFGRQKASSTEILNRWIVPMERRIDYLSFVNGGKITVPFDTFLIFSSNLSPVKLGDEAFLRRIQYKVLLRSPLECEFRTIFLNFCAAQDLEIPSALIDGFISKWYLSTGKPFRRCHPRDVISQAIDYINFKRLPYVLSEELLDRAFASCFASEAEFTEA